MRCEFGCFYVRVFANRTAGIEWVRVTAARIQREEPIDRDLPIHLQLGNQVCIYSACSTEPNGMLLGSFGERGSDMEGGSKVPQARIGSNVIIVSCLDWSSITSSARRCCRPCLNQNHILACMSGHCNALLSSNPSCAVRLPVQKTRNSEETPSKKSFRLHLKGDSIVRADHYHPQKSQKKMQDTEQTNWLSLRSFLVDAIAIEHPHICIPCMSRSIQEPSSSESCMPFHS